MLIILGLITLTFLLFLIYYLQKEWEIFGSFCEETEWAVAGWGCAILLAFVLIFLPLIRTSSAADVKEFKSVEATLEEARQSESISEFELAALQHKIVDTNRWLAQAQFWAKHPLTNWFWVKEIKGLEPIK